MYVWASSRVNCIVIGSLLLKSMLPLEQMHIPNSQHRFKCYYIYVVMYTFTHIESFAFMNFTLQILEFKYLPIPSYQYNNNSSKHKRKRFIMKCSTTYSKSHIYLSKSFVHFPTLTKPFFPSFLTNLMDFIVWWTKESSGDTDLFVTSLNAAYAAW